MIRPTVPAIAILALGLALTACSQGPEQSASPPDPRRDRGAPAVTATDGVNPPAGPAPWVFVADPSSIEDFYSGWPGSAGHEFSNIAYVVEEQAKTAGQMCRSGRPQACPAEQYLSQAAPVLAKTYRSCQKGEMSDCQVYKLRAHEAGQAMQRFDAESRAG